jgi:hypothetical protein
MSPKCGRVKFHEFHEPPRTPLEKLVEFDPPALRAHQNSNIIKTKKQQTSANMSSSTIPKSAYECYRDHVVDEFLDTSAGYHQAIVEASAQWKVMSDTEKKPWELKKELKKRKTEEREEKIMKIDAIRTAHVLTPDDAVMRDPDTLVLINVSANVAAMVRVRSCSTRRR